MKGERAGAVDGTVARLLLASFVVALSTTGFIFAVPFYVLDKLGRTDAVGQVVATWTFGYIICCLLAQHMTHRLSPQKMVTMATAGVAISIFLFRLTSTVWQMSAVALAYGSFLGFFWAPLMGWLSGDAEGVTLSRRLGLFNMSWSSSVVIGPLIASYLVKYSLTLPFTAMAVVMAIGCVVVLTTRYRLQKPRPAFPVEVAGQADAQAPEVLLPTQESLPAVPAKMQYIRYLGWTGALVGYLAIAVYRYQMPHLAETLHMDKVVFGRVATALSLSIAVAFLILARWTGWHSKTRWIFLPQLLLVVVSGLLAWTTNPWALGGLMLAGGFAAGFLYANSVFYGSLGAPPEVRTRRMAIHEICLNIGVIAGSYFGNLLSQHLGPSRVYPYLALTIALIALMQLLLWNLLSWRQHRAGTAFQPAFTTGLKPVLTKQQ